MSSVPYEISNFFLAMQAGKAGSETLAACFAEHASYEEPFSGAVRRHVGKEAVIASMSPSWEFSTEGQHIRIDRVESSGGEILINWTCQSPLLPGGEGSGLNRFVMKNGLIESLVTTLDTSEGNGA